MEGRPRARSRCRACHFFLMKTRRRPRIRRSRSSIIRARSRGDISGPGSGRGGRALGMRSSDGFEGWWLVVGCWWLAGAGGEGAACAALPRTDEQPLATGHWPPSIHASSLSGIAAGKVGEGAGRPGLARCCCRVTVSTKQTCPAQPFSTRPPAGGPCFGPYRIIRRGHCCPGRGRDMAWPAVRSIGARRAGAGHPSTSLRTPGLSSARASSLDHSPPTSRRWIRRPPHRRDGGIMGAVPARMVRDAVIFEKRTESAGCRCGIC